MVAWRARFIATDGRLEKRLWWARSYTLGSLSAMLSSAGDLFSASLNDQFGEAPLPHVLEAERQLRAVHVGPIAV